MKNFVDGTSPGLTISDLAERTGVPHATLRTWESRYGAPRPRRLAGGHRRYVEEDVALVEEVLRHKAAGLSLQAAISRAGASRAEPEPSVFAGLRRRHPDLVPQILSKRTLLALTRAIEDECCARAEYPVLFASFQRGRFYRASRSRYTELARTAERVVVFADFPDPGTGSDKGSGNGSGRSEAGDPGTANGGTANGGTPTLVRVPENAPLQREWLLVCDAPDYPACVTGWELPGQDGIPDAERRFETLWTVEPDAVRDASRICAGLVETFLPAADLALGDRLTGTPAPASPDLRRAQSLFNRMVGYLDVAGPERTSPPG